MEGLSEKAKNMPEYLDLLSRMIEADKERMESTKVVAEEMKFLQNRIYTSIKWPLKLKWPMFDARAAYSVPNNYFQNISLDGERLGVMFTHGAMRSVFFVDDRLMLYSKTVNHYHSHNYFTSFLLLHLEPEEYSYKLENDGTFILSANVEKTMKNLITGKNEKKKVIFNFFNKPVKGRIMTREKVLTSAQFKNIYAKYGGASIKSASIDMEGYALTVPHFAPHPYMLQLHEKFGYASKRDFQEDAINYFKENLGF